MAKAYSPTGHAIVGTLDLIPGTALINPDSFSVGPKTVSDGHRLHYDSHRLTFAWSGETEVDWDNQETVSRNGQRIFVDDVGDEWDEDSIIVLENGVGA